MLEAALAVDEPGSSVLEVYLPQVRGIITNLLQGLRGKQSLYRSNLADRQERKARAEAMGLSSSRSSRQGHNSLPSGDRYTSSSRPASRGISEVGSDYPRNEPTSRPSHRTDDPNIPPIPPRDSSPSRLDVSSRESVPRAYPVPLPQYSQPANEVQPQGRSANADSNPEPSLPNPQRSASPSPPRSSTPVQRFERSRQQSSSRSHVRVLRVDEEERPPSQRSLDPNRQEPPIPPPSEPPSLPQIESSQESFMTTSVPNAGSVPAHVKRYSLSDNPVPQLPEISIEGASPKPGDEHEKEENYGLTSEEPTTPPISESSLTEVMSTPAAEKSLAALKKSDVLPRRASKRFSSYTLTKMVGGPDRSNRKSMLATSSLLTPTDLNTVAGGDTISVPSPSKQRRNELNRNKSLDGLRRVFRPLAEEEEEPPLPPVPAMAREAENVGSLLPATSGTNLEVPTSPGGSETTSSTLINGTLDVTPESRNIVLPPPPASDVSQALTVFLQVGKQVRKTTIEPSGLSFASLRVLFVDKFQYNPGGSDFPSIYIRDPSSGVQYELEDVEEVRDKCLLSLNIERKFTALRSSTSLTRSPILLALDQIKQHIDIQMSTLSQELRDLKTVVTVSRRQSIQISPVSLQTVSPLPTPERPPEKRFRDAAKRLTRVMAKGDFTKFSESPAMPPPYPSQPPTPSPLAPQVTGSSTVSDERATRMVSDLKVQFDEVQNLRRDLGVMRQIYSEFMGSTKDALGQLRGQAKSLHEVAVSQVGGSRVYIDAGKSKLDARSQDLLSRVDDLQDTVEGLRDDVLKRHVQPKPGVMLALKTDIDTTAVELERLREHIAVIKPSWKQAWEEELQNIVEEQQFLNHQEEFVKDLIEDHKALREINDQLAQILSLRTTKKSRNGPKFQPLPVEEGHEGLSTVMLEIRGAQVDPDKRMKAMETNQKACQRELASRSDEFQEELSSFVDGKKLKMTGGGEEVERVRQKRNEMTLKAMFQPPEPLKTR